MELRVSQIVGTLLPGHTSFLNLGFPNCETDTQPLTCPPVGLVLQDELPWGDGRLCMALVANVREEGVGRGDSVEG